MDLASSASSELGLLPLPPNSGLPEFGIWSGRSRINPTSAGGEGGCGGKGYRGARTPPSQPTPLLGGGAQHWPAPQVGPKQTGLARTLLLSPPSSADPPARARL